MILLVCIMITGISKGCVPRSVNIESPLEGCKGEGGDPAASLCAMLFNEQNDLSRDKFFMWNHF